MTDLYCCATAINPSKYISGFITKEDQNYLPVLGDLKNIVATHKTATLLIYSEPKRVVTRKPACLRCSEFLTNAGGLLRCYDEE